MRSSARQPPISRGRRSGDPLPVRLRTLAASYPIKRLCELVEVPRSSFYEWAQPTVVGALPRPMRDLANEIYDIHVASQRTYGAPRVRGQLRHRGVTTPQAGRPDHGRVRPRRRARPHGSGVAARRTRRRHRICLHRDFTAERSDQRWVADITEFECCDGKLYLAGIKDLHDHGLVGWSMGERQTTDLVVDALVMALGPPRPRRRADPPRGPRERNTRRWSSRTGSPTGTSPRPTASIGDCFDNAAMESTWATIKKEIRHIHGHWSDAPAPSSARSCSTTSRSSTTGHATKPASATAPQPRPTLPPKQPDSQQPVSKKPGQLHSRTYLYARPDASPCVDFDDVRRSTASRPRRGERKPISDRSELHSQQDRTLGTDCRGDRGEPSARESARSLACEGWDAWFEAMPEADLEVGGQQRGPPPLLKDRFPTISRFRGLAEMAEH